MNRRLMTILLCAFVVASGASYIVYRLVARQVDGNSRKRIVKVVVAARDLEIGTLIKAADLKDSEVVGAPPKEILLKQEGAIGRGVVSPIFAGEPLSEKRLAKAGSGAGLAATIPPGMRACAVKVDDVVGVAGFVVPGMRVDVLIAGNPQNIPSPGGAKVKTLLQNIEVLSAGKNFQPDSEGKPADSTVVNLLVTPEQAEILTLASSRETRLQLVLRNPGDREIGTPPGSEMASLFGTAKPPTLVAAHRNTKAAAVVPPVVQVEKPIAPSPHIVHVMNGGKATEQKIDLQGAAN